FIADAFDNVVDSLTYSKGWYNDPQKASGGWALERVNPFLSCGDSSNWKASVSPKGGTPGTINSVFDTAPDSRPFMVMQVQAVSRREIAVFFSKSLNAESLQDAGFFVNGNMLTVKEINPSGLLLTLPGEMVHGQSYALQISNLSDC